MGPPDPLAAAHAALSPILSAWRASEALHAATVALGFDPMTALRGLAHELEAWSDPAAFERVWRRDLGPAGEVPVDRFPERVLILAARTLPASAMRQILWARALGAEVLLKPASGQEALGAALCPAGLAGLVCLPARRESAGLDAAFAQADTLIVLGRDETVAGIAARLAPHQRLVAYGHRTSAALVAAPLTDAVADALAADLAAWDQSGCLSPRTLWVHHGEGATASGGLDEVLAPLAAALGRLASPPLGAAAAHAQRIGVTRALMTGARLRQAGGWVLATTEATSGAEVPRWLSVLPFDSGRFERARPHLSTLGLGPGVPETLLGPPDEAGAEPDERSDRALRVCPLGTMQRPPLDWCQDGHLPLRALLRSQPRHP